MISVINITSSFYLQIQAFIKLIIFGWFKFLSIKISCVILFLSPYVSLIKIIKLYDHEFKGLLELNIGNNSFLYIFCKRYYVKIDLQLLLGNFCNFMVFHAISQPESLSYPLNTFL
jgi:hypothetical protein